MSDIILPQRPPQENILQHTFDLYGDDIVDGVVPSSVGDKSRLPSTGRGYNITDPTSLLRFTDLTGITITAFEGTTTPTISGNDITFTAGKLYSLTLSNGAFFNCEDTGLIAFDSSGNGNHGTKVNTDVLAANTFSYESVDAPEPDMNRVGYSDGDGSNNNGLYIPRNEANPKLDVLGNPLQYKGQVSYPAHLVQSNCLSFDGVDDYTTIGNVYQFQTGNGISDNPVTVEFYFKDSGNIYISNLSSSNQRNSYFAARNNLVQFRLYDGDMGLGNTSFTIESYSDVLVNQWNHVKFVYLGTLEQVFIYVNGKIQSLIRGDGNGGYTYQVNLNADWNINKLNTIIAPEGEMSDIKVYDDSVIYLHFPLSEGSGNTVFDASGNNNHGTLINGVSWGVQDVYHYNHSQGYSLYQHNTDTVANPDIRVPLGINPVITDYTKIKDVRPSQRNHNGAETKIDFNPYGAPELSSLNTLYAINDSYRNQLNQFKRDNSDILFYKETITGNKLDRAKNYTKEI